MSSDESICEDFVAGNHKCRLEVHRKGQKKKRWTRNVHHFIITPEWMSHQKCNKGRIRPHSQGQPTGISRTTFHFAWRCGGGCWKHILFSDMCGNVQRMMCFVFFLSAFTKKGWILSPKLVHCSTDWMYNLLQGL